jgi:RNA polymerase sigma factor for flagellar operon FliA
LSTGNPPGASEAAIVAPPRARRMAGLPTGMSVKRRTQYHFVRLFPRAVVHERTLCRGSVLARTSCVSTSDRLESTVPALRRRKSSPRVRDRAARRRSSPLDASKGATKETAAPTLTAGRPTPATALELRDLHDSHAETSARDALVLAHSDLVRSIAYRARYRASTGVPFEAFARRRVHGAIMDSLRDLDWVPRSVRSLQRRANTAAAVLRQQLGREPSRDEVARHLGVNITPGETTRVLHHVAPTEPTQDDLSALEQWPDAAESIESCLLRSEVAAQVRREIARLPVREQQILDSYYRNDLRMAEIGEAIGVCESRVSQLRSAALARLRASLGPALGLTGAVRRDAPWAAVVLEGGLSRSAASRRPVAAPAREVEGEAPTCQAA